MAIDPAVQVVLDMTSAPDAPPLHELSLADARAAAEMLAGLAGEAPDVARTETTSADGVPVHLYWPKGDGPHPVLVFVHGGGFVLGSTPGYDPVIRDLCVRTGCLVISVDYRLAPEHPFPAAIDDLVTVSKWLATNVESLGGDRSRMVVAGDSAGGALSAILANELPGTFALQVLLYPMTDLTMSHPSMEENGEGYMLTKDAVHWCVGHYLSDGGDPTDPRVSPLHAEDVVLAAAPPALILTAEFDPLRDEGEAYAARLRAAGVEVEQRRYDGMIHGFFCMAGAVPASTEALEQVADAVRRATR